MSIPHTYGLRISTAVPNPNVTITNAYNGCAHHFCGNGWITVGSTTGGDPGGMIAWSVCCKCGATSEPARGYGP